MGEDLVEHPMGDEDPGLDTVEELASQRKTGGADDAGRRQTREGARAHRPFDFETPVAVELSGGEVRGTSGGPEGIGHLGELEEELGGGDAAADDEGAQSAEVLDAAELGGVELQALELGDAGDEGDVGMRPRAGGVDDEIAGEVDAFAVEADGDLQWSGAGFGRGHVRHLGGADDAEFEFVLEAGVVVGDDRRGGDRGIGGAQREAGEVGDVIRRPQGE